MNLLNFDSLSLWDLKKKKIHVGYCLDSNIGPQETNV